jgi:hypothetical protein
VYDEALRESLAFLLRTADIEAKSYASAAAFLDALPGNPYPFMLAALAGVWAVNFFVVLPLVSPAFVHIVPYAVSLTSKLLFGVAAAEIVRDDAIFAARRQISSRISANEKTY